MLYVNDVPVPTTMFPDNTSQVWHLGDLPARVIVRWDYTHEGEFMQLAQLKTLLDRRGVLASLTVPYLPYARQDKEVADDKCFALRTFAKMLNQLDFEEVNIVDAHSDAAIDLIAKAWVSHPTSQVHEIATGYDIVCYPDHGALVKYDRIYDIPYICASKVRDQATGEITGMALQGECVGMAVLIVDDICDGAATFVTLAGLLRAAGATNVGLFVTHGIFSRGLRPLHDAGIRHIYTASGPVTEKDLQCPI